MKATLKLIVIFCALGVLAACGTPGAPMLPSLELANPPQDLAAARKGDKVTLTWTPPTRTTDQENIRAKFVGPTVICRAVSDVPVTQCVQSVGQVPPVIPGRKEKGEKRPEPLPRSEYVDNIPSQLQLSNPTGFAEYGVEVRNSRGRSAGLSNQVKVPLAPILPPPNLSAQMTAAGIELRYCAPQPSGTINPSLQFAARIYREQKGSTNAVVVSGEPANPGSSGTGCSAAAILDRSFDWESTYEYWVAMVTTVLQNDKPVAEVEGDNSPLITVFAHDIFPPAVPTGLQAVASGVGQKPFVDLTWIPDIDPDLAGYNIYRQGPGGQWVQINSAPVPTPSFRDENVVPDQSYTYAVSAVDVHQNESARSEPTSESVP